MNDIVRIGQTTNAAIYDDGNKLVGIFKEFDQPEIEYDLVKHAALGMVAELERPGRMLKSMKGKGVFQYLDADFVPRFLDPRAAVPIMIEAYTDMFDANGLAVASGYRVITHVTLSVFKDGGKAFKLGDAFEGNFEYTAQRFVQKFSNQSTPFREIDAINQINRLNGVDVWPTY